MKFEELESVEKEIVSEYWNEIDDTASIDHILESYEWSGSLNDFIDYIIKEWNFELPWWIFIDYEKTWDAISYDYTTTSNYIFRNI